MRFSHLFLRKTFRWLKVTGKTGAKEGHCYFYYYVNREFQTLDLFIHKYWRLKYGNITNFHEIQYSATLEEVKTASMKGR